MTLYFAKEVPLTPKHPHHLSDSAPLLNEPQQNGSELSKLEIDTEFRHVPLEVKPDGHGMDNDRIVERKISEDDNTSLTDSPGAVLVNLLTSLRHLPPAMHSVLVVMALTWVSTILGSLYH